MPIFRFFKKIKKNKENDNFLPTIYLHETKPVQTNMSKRDPLLNSTHVIGALIWGAKESVRPECHDLTERFPEQGENLIKKHRRKFPKKWKQFPKNTGAILTALFTFISMTFFFMMWFTDVYDNSILKLVSIRNDLEMIFDLWRFPPTRPIIKLHIFNYTNYREALNGTELPKVEEIGPYVFQERSVKVNIKFNDNGTVTFQDNKTVQFLPELSKGTLNDTFYTINIPVITTLNLIRKKDFGYQSVFDLANIAFFKTELFPHTTVNSIIWGYDDNFYSFMRNMQSLWLGAEVPKYGILAAKPGLHGTVTEETGDIDLDEVGQITRFHGKDKIGHWGSTECDEIKGSEGSLFPGKRVANKEKLYIYSHDMCRRLPIVFNKSTESPDGFPVHEYHFVENLFDYSEASPENHCYKYRGRYPPSGFFSTAPCHNDVPMYTSFPHFWKSDSNKTKLIMGLKPDPVKHESKFLLHDRLGICLKAQSRFQLNMRLTKGYHIMQMNYGQIQNETLFPIAWVDYDSGTLPEYFVNIVYHLTYTVRTIQECLKWISFIFLFISVFLVYKQIRTRYINF